MRLSLEFIDGISYATLIMIGVICGIVFVTIFILLLFRFNSFKNDELIEYLSHPVEANSFFEVETDRYCRYVASLMTFLGRGDDSQPYYRKLKSKVMPLVFSIEDDGGYGVNYFSTTFCDFVVHNCDSEKVRQYGSVLRRYISSRYRDIPVEDHVSAVFHQRLADDIMTDVISKELDSLAYSEYYQDKYEADAFVMAENEWKKEKDQLSHELSKASYNLTVKDIKLNDNKGLIPLSQDYLKPRFLQYLCDMKIYTHQKLLGMYDTPESYDFCCEGCYIILNTNKNKYFVGRSDNMFMRVYSLLKDNEFKGCKALKEDILSGDYILAKFVPLEGSGFTNLMRMQRDLILSYDCRGDNGYNK